MEGPQFKSSFTTLRRALKAKHAPPGCGHPTRESLQLCEVNNRVKKDFSVSCNSDLIESMPLKVSTPLIYLALLYTDWENEPRRGRATYNKLVAHPDLAFRFLDNY